jgi:hypothetical protein
MTAVRATWQNGQIIPDRSVDWPEGCELIVAPVANEASQSLHKEDLPCSSEEIAEQLRLMDQIQPFIMTPEEDAAWQADRRAQREFEKSKFFEHAEELRKMWD